MIYLDTNAVVWLAGAPETLSPHAQTTINDATRLLISPMVILELTYLFEIGRLRHAADDILDHLRRILPMTVCDRPFSTIVAAASSMTWTRDPFDRLITAQASLGEDILLTRDRGILAHYAHAQW